jgi:Mg2+ and Co2+ transporter CorA
MIGEVD